MDKEEAGFLDPNAGCAKDARSLPTCSYSKWICSQEGCRNWSKSISWKDWKWRLLATQSQMLFTQMICSFLAMPVSRRLPWSWKPRTTSPFTRVSGQQVGPTKSTLWFNNCTNPVLRKQVSDIILVNSSAVTTTYLGAPIATTAQAFDFLVESFSSRLQAWKSKLLSQAGRIVLIKAVLQSVPIYYMATTIIPQKVLSKLTSLIRRFYWGKVDQPRYMALLS